MSNPYYTASGTPATGSFGASAPMRGEFDSIEAGFALLPQTLTANKAVVVNAGGTALTVTAGSLALAGNFTTTGAFAVTLASVAPVTLTLPASNGTIATVDGALGNVTVTTINKVSITQPATGATLTIADGKTLTASNTLTLAGTDSTTMTFPSSSATMAGLAIAQTFTARQTLAGSTSVLAALLSNAAEVCTISATAATGTIDYDITTQSVLYYTSNAAANWTVNFRASSGTTLNTAMGTGQSVTVAFLVQQGGTAYYNSAVTVDGVSVTPKYIGGAAWSAGHANSIDIYLYTIIKTGNAAFTVVASQAVAA